LGYTYETGEGIKQDYLLALQHFLFAATKDAEARKHLILIFRGQPDEISSRVDWNLYKMVAVKYLADKWPDSHNMLDWECKIAILEIFYLMMKYYHLGMGCRLPRELLVLIVKCIVLVWPYPHGGSLIEV